jgi:hypothetical protein
LLHPGDASLRGSPFFVAVASSTCDGWAGFFGKATVATAGGCIEAGEISPKDEISMGVLGWLRLECLPCRGMADLRAGIIRTPLPPKETFLDGKALPTPISRPAGQRALHIAARNHGLSCQQPCLYSAALADLPRLQMKPAFGLRATHAAQRPVLLAELQQHGGWRTAAGAVPADRLQQLQDSCPG